MEAEKRWYGGWFSSNGGEIVMIDDKKTGKLSDLTEGDIDDSTYEPRIIGECSSDEQEINISAQEINFEIDSPSTQKIAEILPQGKLTASIKKEEENVYVEKGKVNPAPHPGPLDVTQLQKSSIKFKLPIHDLSFTGRCPIKQYVKNKPSPIGLKNFLLCASSGIVMDFEIYQGNSTLMINQELGPSVVMKLVQTLPQGSFVYFDRYFTTLPLLKKLSELKIYGAGTIMANRINGLQLTKADKMERAKKIPKRNQKDLLQFKLEITEALAVIPSVNRKIVSDEETNEDVEDSTSTVKRSKYHNPPAKKPCTNKSNEDTGGRRDQIPKAMNASVLSDSIEHKVAT
ncbi:hypothetical protein AVEN_243596-1 [Araneus ventricosus]|uniref:PiggyBac transposable element-derived protein domain-containing protein n=1 Tax=Araneus ventricosus TaxID=182803 RepID=A0A4Y2A4E0_ARAVE|nr:hypothetical protein AVEN_243596-1 [Araneus ventricosus]